MPRLTIFIGRSNAALDAAVDRAIDTTANAFEVRRWPEMHASGPLHPSFHGAEADACARASRTRPVVVCTHSDPFVLRVRRRIAEQTIRPERVSLVWVEDDGTERPIPLNDRGTPAWWPKIEGVSVFAEAADDWTKSGLRNDGSSGSDRRRFCEKRWLVVPAPWNRYVFNTRDLPAPDWGLIEIGTGSPVYIHEATERKNVESPTEAFHQALLAAGCTAAEDEAASEAPLVHITRPSISRTHAGLACGHVTQITWKVGKPPAKVPCFHCLAGDKLDLEMAEAVIEEADPDDLRALAAKIERRLQLETGT